MTRRICLSVLFNVPYTIRADIKFLSSCPSSGPNSFIKYIYAWTIYTVQLSRRPSFKLTNLVIGKIAFWSLQCLMSLDNINTRVNKSFDARETARRTRSGWGGCIVNPGPVVSKTRPVLIRPPNHPQRSPPPRYIHTWQIRTTHQLTRLETHIHTYTSTRTSTLAHTHTHTHQPCAQMHNHGI